MILVFGSPISPFVDKVHRALALKKLDYQLVEPKSFSDFKKWNPQTRKMPVMEMEGERVYDSTFICERLDEIRPDPPLLSTDPLVRAQQRLLEDWADESLYWHLMGMRWSRSHAAATASQIAGTLPGPVALIAKPLLSRQIREMTRAQGMGRLPEDVLLRETGARFDDLVALLDGRPFFLAEEPSRADLAVCGQLHMGMSGPTPEVGDLVNARPVLRDYLSRVRGRTGG
jgi:glutathione S-transferase